MNAQTTDQEIVRRGEEIYLRSIRNVVENSHLGEFVAIDIDSGTYEVDPDLLKAASRLKSLRPSATLYSLRVGYPALAKIGGAWPHKSAQ